jgi:membrane-associated phospholipid phosphatase
VTRRPLVLLALSGAVALLAALVWVVAFHTGAGTRADNAVLRALIDAASPPLEPRIAGIAQLADPLPFVLAGGALCLVALVRRRPLMALTVVAVLAAANVTTQILKPALGDPRVVELLGTRLDYPASWPSGHSTASMSLALCAVLVAGPRWRPLAAMVGAAYAVAVGYALVALGWHLPSDVLGGYLVATSFTLLGAAALALAERGRLAPVAEPLESEPAGPWRPAFLAAPLGAILGGLGALLVAAYAALSRSADASRLVADHTGALVAGTGIALLGVLLTAGIALVLRRE